MQENLLTETILRIETDCIELIEAVLHQEEEVVREFCYVYLPFIDKRYQVLIDLKRDTIRKHGLFMKHYYESILREIETLMGILLRNETMLIHSQSLLLLSLCYDVSVKFLDSTTKRKARYPESTDTMKERAVTYITDLLNNDPFPVENENSPKLNVIAMHR